MTRLILLFLLFPAFVYSTDWKTKTSPNFNLYYEGKWTPDSIMIELEKIFAKMRLNVSMFAPWMTKNKTNIYIYSSQENYLKGEFAPPTWSKGLAFYDKKAVVVYDMGDIEKLKSTLAHELTHLYFESYFSEKMKTPPQWLNEGLAVFMEDLTYESEGPWKRALKFTMPEKFLKFSVFFDTKIENLDSSEKISNWYLQAYGIVSYLYRPNKRLAFKNLCDLIREDYKIEKNLWEAYRFRTASDLELEWKKWLIQDKETQKKALIDNAGFGFKPFKQIEFSTGLGKK
ncbi:MAG: hypothetical protein GX447_04030 [Elusimicrobia bacterium]|nr:hypothetical protein [Elusimicrobiota bacterium]